MNHSKGHIVLFDIITLQIYKSQYYSIYLSSNIRLTNQLFTAVFKQILDLFCLITTYISVCTLQVLCHCSFGFHNYAGSTLPNRHFWAPLLFFWQLFSFLGSIGFATEMSCSGSSTITQIYKKILVKLSSTISLELLLPADRIRLLEIVANISASETGRKYEFNFILVNDLLGSIHKYTDLYLKLFSPQLDLVLPSQVNTTIDNVQFGFNLI